MQISFIINKPTGQYVYNKSPAPACQDMLDKRMLTVLLLKKRSNGLYEKYNCRKKPSGRWISESQSNSIQF
jgi:hypothetical protein